MTGGRGRDRADKDVPAREREARGRHERQEVRANMEDPRKGVKEIGKRIEDKGALPLTHLRKDERAMDRKQ